MRGRKLEGDVSTQAGLAAGREAPQMVERGIEEAIAEAECP